MDVKLVMFKSDGTRRDFSLDKPRVVLGRTNSADLRIPLSSVSRQHCEITVQDREVKLRDLGSSNGTYHNGTRIQEAKLLAGDEVVVGPVVFTVVIDGRPAEIKPVRTMVGGAEVKSELASPVAPAEAPRKLEPHGDADEALPLEVETETYTPTIELDDPLAALKKAAEQPEPAPPTGADDDDLPLLADEDEDIPLLADDDEQSKKQR